jgi:hypothetical protein
METREGVHPFKKIEIFGGRTTVDLAEGAELDSVVEMDLLEDFWPSITAEEARLVAGDPDRVVLSSAATLDRWRGDFYYYDKDRATIRISKVTHGSGGMPSQTKWYVYMFPKAGFEETIVSERIIELIDSETRELSIYASRDSIQIFVEKGKPYKLIWERAEVH